jgi:hypothetical protein
MDRNYARGLDQAFWFATLNDFVDTVFSTVLMIDLL